MNKKLIAVLALVVIAAVVFLNRGGKEQRSISGLEPPVQQAAEGGVQLEESGYSVNITFKYSYEIDAVVLSARSYHGSSLGDRLAPKDLALGWGTVAEYNDRIDFHWSQSGRWYYWRVNSDTDLSPVGGSGGVAKQSANNHIIPADDSVKKQLGRVKKGDHVIITGYLVDLRGEKPDGSYFTWNSSVSRDDTGDGACELIYATDIRILS